MTFSELVEHSANQEILTAFCKGLKHLERCYGRAMCAISGGSDSDIMMDMVCVLDNDHKVDFVFYDTGLEFAATKEHLEYLENRYDREIIRLSAIKPIPVCCREYGIPWFSKFASDMMARLQAHNFQWEIAPFDELCEKYPGCKAALRWWCNEHAKTPTKSGKMRKSSYNINRNALMREFISANPPTFNISERCCYYAKKLVADRYMKEKGYELNIIGLRRAEGGKRSTTYSSCFSPGYENGKGYDIWLPLFWFSDADKRAYEEKCGIVHSKAYTEYGLTRTGCFGCPYNGDFEMELKAIETHEPKLYKAALAVFGPAYEYSKAYKIFKEESKAAGNI